MKYYYYPHTIRNVVVALSDVFNKIVVYRYAADRTTIVKSIPVPLKFGPAEKYHQFDMQRQSGKKYYLTVPAISLNLTSIDYSSDRATSVNEVREWYDKNVPQSIVDDFWADVQPTPYDIHFDMDIRTESYDDWCQILENILPYFNPAIHLRVKEFSFLNIERNLKVNYDGLSVDMNTELSEEDFRHVNGKISLTVSAYLYRPIDYTKAIKYINAKLMTEDTMWIHSISAVANSDIGTSAMPTSFETSGAIDSMNSWFAHSEDVE
jgi:hypothetical protein